MQGLSKMEMGGKYAIVSKMQGLSEAICKGYNFRSELNYEFEKSAAAAQKLVNSLKIQHSRAMRWIVSRTKGQLQAPYDRGVITL